MRTVLLGIVFATLLVNVLRHNEIVHRQLQLQTALNEVRDAQERQTRTLAAMGVRVAEMQRIRAEVTAYTLDHDETDNDPYRTADMTKPVPGRTAAVSRDLIHLLGKKVYIPGHGVRIVNDLAAKDVRETVDLLVGNKAEARKIGREVREVIVL